MTEKDRVSDDTTAAFTTVLGAEIVAHGNGQSRDFTVRITAYVNGRVLELEAETPDVTRRDRPVTDAERDLLREVWHREAG